MNSIDIIKTSFTNVKRRKKQNILNFTIIFLIFLIIGILNSFYKTINVYYDNQINNNPLFRTYTVNYNKELFSHEEVIELFNKTEHIIKILDSNNFSTSVLLDNEQMSGVINIYGADETTLPKIIQGTGFTTNDSDLLVCPTKFLLGNINDYSLTKENFIDTTTLLNNKIKTIFNEYYYKDVMSKPSVLNIHNKEFKLVGLFDSDQEYIDNDYCFTSYGTVGKINSIKSGNKREIYSEEEDFLIIVVDKIQNTEEIINKFYSINGDKFGISLKPISEIDMQYVSNVIMMIYIVTIVLILMFVIFCLIFMLKNLKSRKNEISLLKTLGYKNSDINKLFLLEQIILITISFILSSITCLIISILLNILFDNYYLNLSKINVCFPFLHIFLIFLIFLIFTYLFSSLILKKITKLNPIESLKS